MVVSKGTTCVLLSSATSSSSPWICAWNPGNPIDSTSETYTLNQHGPNSMRQFTFDLSAATLSSDTNPFVAASTSAPSSAPSGASSTSPSSPSAFSSPAAGSGSSTSATVGSDLQNLPDYEKAHGIIMATTVVLLFPLGASYMRLLGNASLHALLQIFSLIALICGFGLGVKLAQMTDFVCPLLFQLTFSALLLLFPFLPSPS